MEKQFSIVIAEDHVILREGLKSLLSSHPDLKVVGEAGDGLEAIRSVQKHFPDLVLMDLSMPRMTGLDAIKEVKRVSPQTKIVVLTIHSEEEYIVAALRAGADGYILKEGSSNELLTAIRHVLGGRRYLTPSISTTIIDCFLQRKEGSGIRSAWETLTQREKEVLKLVAEGYSNKEIAEFLCISVKTVEKHRSNLMAKLGVHNAVALTAWAAEKGLINK
jgi:RNA polymerase sigma factor (sigma-70 family)